LLEISLLVAFVFGLKVPVHLGNIYTFVVTCCIAWTLRCDNDVKVWESSMHFSQISVREIQAYLTDVGGH